MSRSHKRVPSAYKSTQFDALDFYRYAGALVVALVHFVYLHLPVAMWIKERFFMLQPLMGFFFTLSGFVMMHVYDGRMSTLAEYTDYLKKRLARIYPLHLATLVLAIGGGLFVTHANWFDSDAILANVLLLHAWNTTRHLSFNYPSWSVSAEFFVYLLFPLFLWATNFLGSWGALLLSLLSGVVITLFFDVFGLGSWTYATANFGCLRAVPSFLAGVAIYRITTTQFSGLVVPNWLAHGSAIATLPMMLLGVPGKLMLIFFVFVVFALARAESATQGILSRPLPRALANSSYGFYMLHAFVGAIMIGYVPHILHLGDAWIFGMAAAAFVVTTVLAMLSFRFFEEPLRRYLSGSRPRRAAAAASFRREPIKSNSLV